MNYKFHLMFKIVLNIREIKFSFKLEIVRLCLTCSTCSTCIACLIICIQLGIIAFLLTIRTQKHTCSNCALLLIKKKEKSKNLTIIPFSGEKLL